MKSSFCPKSAEVLVVPPLLKKIVIIEDDQMIVTSFRRLLSQDYGLCLLSTYSEAETFLETTPLKEVVAFFFDGMLDNRQTSIPLIKSLSKRKLGNRMVAMSNDLNLIELQLRAGCKHRCLKTDLVNMEDMLRIIHAG